MKANPAIIKQVDTDATNPMTTTSIPTTTELVCPPSWTEWENHCYLFVSSADDWQGAERYCNSQGANLASVHSYMESDFLYTFTNRADSWLGGTDSAAEGRWEWSDGTPFDYTTWESDQPNGDGDCLRFQDTNFWDGACSDNYSYVCKL